MMKNFKVSLSETQSFFSVGNGEPSEVLVQGSNVTRAMISRGKYDGRKSLQKEKDWNRTS